MLHIVCESSIFQTLRNPARAWEVAEVHISGLKSSESNESIGHKIRAAGCAGNATYHLSDGLSVLCERCCILIEYMRALYIRVGD